MPDKLNNVTSEKVAAATGKTWDEWIAAIDGFGGTDMSHRQIVRALHEDAGVTSGWWCQMITVGYELAKGRRERGETTAGFEVGVQRTLPVSPTVVWELITGRPGLHAWLGDVGELAFTPGEKYEAGDGTRGEIRTVKDGVRLRLTWQPAERERPTTLQLYLEDKGDRTRLGFHHEGLAGTDERERMRERWQRVADDLKRLAAGG